MIANKKILVYGANGYTGKLFIKHLINKGIHPILAGRNKTIIKQAKRLNLESRIFETKDSLQYLWDIDIVINVAGAFEITQKELLNSCIKTGSHYLDIANDINDVKQIYDYQDEIEKAKIIAIPGAGFGTTPTNIAANLAMDEIDNPNQLSILYSAKGKFSSGLKRYFLKTIKKPGYIVKDSILKPAVAACKFKKFSVFGVEYKGFYNPWRGDLFTLHKNYNLKTIETYTAFSPLALDMINGKRKWLRKLMLTGLLSLRKLGPSMEEIQQGKTFIKAVVTNEVNEKVSVEIMGPDSNQFTIECLYKLTLCLIEAQSSFGIKTASHFGTGILDDIEDVKIFSKFELEPIFRPISLAAALN